MLFDMFISIVGRYSHANVCLPHRDTGPMANVTNEQGVRAERNHNCSVRPSRTRKGLWNTMCVQEVTENTIFSINFSRTNFYHFSHSWLLFQCIKIILSVLTVS